MWLWCFYFQELPGSSSCKQAGTLSNLVIHFLWLCLTALWHQCVYLLYSASVRHNTFLFPQPINMRENKGNPVCSLALFAYNGVVYRDWWWANIFQQACIHCEFRILQLSNLFQENSGKICRDTKFGCVSLLWGCLYLTVFSSEESLCCLRGTFTKTVTFLLFLFRKKWLNSFPRLLNAGNFDLELPPRKHKIRVFAQKQGSKIENL